MEEVVRLIKGKIGTTVQIHVQRDGRIKIFQVLRDKIHLSFIEEEQLSSQTYYIQLGLFAFGIDTEMRESLTRFTESNTNKLILDLRDNPG